MTDPLGQITRYTYNGDGKRVSMTDARGKTNFIYDGSEVLAEADATGTIKIAYTRMPNGRLVSQWQGGETFWYHLDALGSTIALTDESGKIRNKYGYDEYGNPLSGNTEEVFNRFTFTGQAWDAGVGLYHYKARYYNPAIGRFLTQDTWKGSPWQPWTQNLYSYVGNNPVNYVDPTGHWPEWLGTAWDYTKTGLSYAAGFGYEYSNDMLLGLPGNLGLNAVMDDLGGAIQAGRYGAVAAMTSSTITLAGGAGSLEALGLAACLETAGGGCAVAGAAAIELALAPGQAVAASRYLMYYKPTAQGRFVEGLERAKSKSQRKRWVNEDGEIFEWDSRHGELEKYDKRGRHLGSFDPETGEQIKDPVSGRRIEP